MNFVTRRLHWRPRYLIDRVAELCYKKTNPDDPWLTKQANGILETYLKKTDVGVEFGSGRSTIWLARRVHHLVSVEHHEKWHGLVQAMFVENGIRNVDYHLCPKVEEGEDVATSSYVAVMDRFEPGSLDFALIDGVYRDLCAIRVVDALRPGGVMIIDNVNRYLPYPTRAPHSRPAKLGPASPLWGEVLGRIAAWRSIRTSSGVTDTAFFFKPCVA